MYGFTIDFSPPLNNFNHTTYWRQCWDRRTRTAVRACRMGAELRREPRIEAYTAKAKGRCAATTARLWPVCAIKIRHGNLFRFKCTMVRGDFWSSKRAEKRSRLMLVVVLTQAMRRFISFALFLS